MFKNIPWNETRTPNVTNIFRSDVGHQNTQAYPFIRCTIKKYIFKIKNEHNQHYSKMTKMLQALLLIIVDLIKVFNIK